MFLSVYIFVLPVPYGQEPPPPTAVPRSLQPLALPPSVPTNVNLAVVDGYSLNVSFGNLLLNRGVKLLVQGLKAAPELNGTKATISGFDDERGRYIVKIEGQGRAKALKPENCGLAFQPSLHSFPKN